MGFNYDQLTTPGVEHGPYPPVRLGVYALCGIDVETNGRSSEMEREHQVNSTIAAIETAWDEGRVPSEEADRLLLGVAEMAEA